MEKSSSTTSHNSSATHRSRVQHSSTLNRKYVQRPTNVRSRNRSAATASAAEAEARAIRAIQKAEIQKRRRARAAEMNKSYPAAAKRGQVTRQSATANRPKPQATRSIDLPAQPHPMQTRARAAACSARAASSPQLTAQQRKDAAIASALRSVATMDQSNTITSQSSQKSAAKKSKKVKSRHSRTASSGSGKRFLIAFSCAAACVIALALFIGTNSPDLSVRVAAMQTGIDASYPSYIPRDYSLTDVSSGDNEVTMRFASSDASFTLTEEHSSWDTTALLNNYVKPTWSDNYTATHEQGITIYMSGSNAAWVNGNIFYTITDNTGTLTKKQIRNIVTSL